MPYQVHQVARALFGPSQIRARRANHGSTPTASIVTANRSTRRWQIGQQRGAVRWTLHSRPPSSSYREADEVDVRLRSEAEAPFRAVRLLLYGFFMVSAGVASLIAITQTIAAIGGAPRALPLNDTLQTLGIDVAGVIVFALLFRGDWQARNKQMARLQREESLAACQVELANKKMLRLGALRGSVRPVVLVGTAEQVRAALDAATACRDELMQRGIFIIPVPIYGDTSNADDALPPLTQEDLKWRGKAVRTEQWSDWFEQQMAMAGKTADAGLYVGLRIDGRVRASGTGIPPWRKFVAQIPPEQGMWKGFFDGMDGRVL